MCRNRTATEVSAAPEEPKASALRATSRMRVPAELPPVALLQPLVNRAVAETGFASFPHSCAYLLRDLVYVAVVAFFTRALDNAGLPMLVLYPLYSVAMGTVLTGLWVLGHEAGHGAFGSTVAQNDAVGFMLHSLLLVPYYSWQFTHAKHHRHTNHLVHGETHVPSTLASCARDAMLHELLASQRRNCMEGGREREPPLGLACQQSPIHHLAWNEYHRRAALARATAGSRALLSVRAALVAGGQPANGPRRATTTWTRHSCSGWLRS